MNYKYDITTDDPKVPRLELEQKLHIRAWTDNAFRQEFLANPKTVLERDYAQYFPEGKISPKLTIKVIEESDQILGFVLPPKLSDDQLSGLKDLNDEELIMTTGGGPQCTSAFSFCITACPVSVCHRGITNVKIRL